MAFAYDFNQRYIYVPQGNLNVQDLLDDIRNAEATSVGITYPQIASASGKESLGDGVNIGLTLNLLGWQLKFPDAGNIGYTVKIYGGNLVGGVSGETIAYSEGVQVLIVQSAASTIVTQSTGSGLSPEQDSILRQAAASAASANNAANSASIEASKARKMQTNKAIISGDNKTVAIYDDDGMTLLHVFHVSDDLKSRIPQ